MYEEVCLLCGRPVLADGRPYCSDECESLDVTSPSISTTSSAQPSPFLHSTTNPPTHLSEVPALLPSTLGLSLNTNALKSHRVRHSVSSSSTSSASWSALEDDAHDDENLPPVLHHTNTDDEFYAVTPDYLSENPAPKPVLGYGFAFRHPSSSLAYVRRPSSTNNRSMIPTLHHRTPSNSTPFVAGISRSIPYDCSTEAEDDPSDGPSAPAITISRSARRKGRETTESSAHVADWDREKEQETVGCRSRRNRASLPAYFSLLTSTSTTPRSHKGASAISMLSRSLHSSSSPPTPRLARPVVDTTTAFATAQSPRVSKEQPQVADVVLASRGRSKHRGSEERRSSSPSRSPRVRPHVHHNAHARARLDSMEKVAEWVAHSPVVNAGARVGRHLAHRRNSSPPPLPKFEKVDLCDSGVDIDSSYDNCVVEGFDDDDDELPTEDTQRGRRRVDELDQVPTALVSGAPGYGNGRSGLLARERERGRIATVKR